MILIVRLRFLTLSKATGFATESNRLMSAPIACIRLSLDTRYTIMNRWYAIDH